MNSVSLDCVRCLPPLQAVVVGPRFVLSDSAAAPKAGVARTRAARSRVGPTESVEPAAPSDPEQR